jgi:hypothetical protein
MKVLERGPSLQSFCHDSDVLLSKLQCYGQPHFYLPYLIPVSSVLFLAVKTAIRGSRFQDIDDMKNVTTKLNMVSLNVIDDWNLERCKEWLQGR